MKALKHTQPVLSFVAAVIAVMMISCTDTEAGIFSRVVAETPISDNMTADIQDATPSFVVRLGTTYFAGIGTLWMKADGDKFWEKATLPTEFNGTVFSGSGVVVNDAGTDKLFVAFSSSTGSSLGIWSTADGETWDHVDSAFPDAGYVRTILSAYNTVFAVTATSALVDAVLTEYYSIHYYNGTSFVTAGVSDNSEIGMPGSVAYDGATYWFTAGSNLIKGTPPALAVIAGPSTTDTTSGVCAYGTGVIVSSRNGYLYQSSDGVTWITSTQNGSSASDGYSFSVPTYVNDANLLLVGTNKVPRSSSDIPDAAGYLQFNLATDFTAIAISASDTAISSATNFASSLADISVNAMPVFTHLDGKKMVFALTDGDGLWSNTYSGTSWGGWVRE